MPDISFFKIVKRYEQVCYANVSEKLDHPEVDNREEILSSLIDGCLSDFQNFTFNNNDNNELVFNQYKKIKSGKRVFHASNTKSLDIEILDYLDNEPSCIDQDLSTVKSDKKALFNRFKKFSNIWDENKNPYPKSDEFLALKCCIKENTLELLRIKNLYYSIKRALQKEKDKAQNEPYYISNFNKLDDKLKKEFGAINAFRELVDDEIDLVKIQTLSNLNERARKAIPNEIDDLDLKDNISNDLEYKTAPKIDFDNYSKNKTVSDLLDENDFKKSLTKWSIEAFDKKVQDKHREKKSNRYDDLHYFKFNEEYHQKIIFDKSRINIYKDLVEQLKENDFDYFDYEENIRLEALFFRKNENKMGFGKIKFKGTKAQLKSLIMAIVEEGKEYMVEIPEKNQLKYRIAEKCLVIYKNGREKEVDINSLKNATKIENHKYELLKEVFKHFFKNIKKEKNKLKA